MAWDLPSRQVAADLRQDDHIAIVGWMVFLSMEQLDGGSSLGLRDNLGDSSDVTRSREALESQTLNQAGLDYVDLGSRVQNQTYIVVVTPSVRNASLDGSQKDSRRRRRSLKGARVAGGSWNGFPLS